MNMSVSVANVRCLDDGVWKARLSPAEARILGSSSNSYGSVSIVLVTDKPSFDETNSRLSFNPTSAQVLNLGSSDQAIIISEQCSEGNRKGLLNRGKTSGPPAGDARFLGELSPELKELGTAVLKKIREHFPGELKYYPKSGKYVETPDNFWTVRIQARDKSLRFTVRGRPDSFHKPKTLQLKPDMTGYSSFKIFEADQIGELIDVLQQVPKK